MMKKLLSLLLTLSVLATFAVSSASALSPEPRRYDDVTTNHKYYSAIEFISNAEIVDGYDDGTYKPQGTLNRAELLKIVIEANYADEFEAYSQSNCFKDVPAGEWYTQYVCFAEDVGIVNGYPDGTFKPADNINLVEAVKISLKSFGYLYPDAEPWYKGPIVRASDNNFIPLDFKFFEQTVNRGQMADMITRMLKYDDGLLEIYLEDKVDYVVDYDSLESKTDVENLYMNKIVAPLPTESSASLEALALEACGANSNSCDFDKTEFMGCTSVSELEYFTMGFLACHEMGVTSGDVLVFNGGLGQGGYSLLAWYQGEVGGSIVKMRNISELSEFWGPISNQESALEFVKAATGKSEAYNVADLENISVADDQYALVLTDEGSINYSNVVWDGAKYMVTLYSSELFGCLDFSLYESSYSVGESGITLEKIETKTIGSVQTGYCAD